MVNARDGRYSGLDGNPSNIQGMLRQRRLTARVLGWWTRLQRRPRSQSHLPSIHLDLRFSSAVESSTLDDVLEQGKICLSN
jgi:hypothetical protein